MCLWYAHLFRLIALLPWTGSYTVPLIGVILVTMTHQATARSYSNIAFIKYWGNQDDDLCIPANDSISMNLEGLQVVTTVRFDDGFESDRLTINDQEMGGDPLTRVSVHLDHIRQMAATDMRAEVVSESNFPAGAGMASSAAAFAALSAAACDALGLNPDERQLSTLARLGSGSASRSIPGGYVEWYAGNDHESSYAETIAPPDHWNLIDLVAIISKEHKATGSTGGHRLASTSLLQAARVADTPRRIKTCRQAILERDFEAFTQIVEHDTLLMHAVMMTCQPSLIYWLPETLELIEATRRYRAEGLPVCFTIDAGPNVHMITTADYQDQVKAKLADIRSVQEVLVAGVGGPTELV
jgi:diphosphomevalonate decarboxylase